MHKMKKYNLTVGFNLFFYPKYWTIF